MKTLRRPNDYAEIIQRLRRLRPESQRRWGRMNAGQMVCHLADAFRGILGERRVQPTSAHDASASPLSPAPMGHARQLFFKVVALYLPVHWPHGIKTRPDVDQEIGGTPPSDFAVDLTTLEAACARFVAANAPGARCEHFMFGPLTDAEWCRWGYRHMDHHLRQFGV